MTKLEMACVIMGLIGLFCNGGIKAKGSAKSVIAAALISFLEMAVCALMVLLPLYFRYWRR